MDDKEEGIKEFLVDRYTKRGNPPYWIKKVIKFLDIINNYVEENKINTIILNKNENIENKLKELNWLY